MTLDARILARIGAVLLGVWLIAAPAVLGYSGVAADTHRLLGPIAGGTAFVAIAQSIHMLRWLTVPVGLLLVAAPVLGFPAEATVNSIVTGLAITALGFVEREPSRDFGGGWRVLWQGRERRPA